MMPPQAAHLWTPGFPGLCPWWPARFAVRLAVRFGVFFAAVFFAAARFDVFPLPRFPRVR